MPIKVVLLAMALAVSAPATAQSEFEIGLDGALRGCEKWVLEPASWTDGLGPFLSNLGLGKTAGWVGSVEEAALPPPQMRVASHYLRINSSPNAGFILVVSDRLPFCHITGGGAVDLQPTVEKVLKSDSFNARWQETGQRSAGDMVATFFRNRSDPKFEMVISRAKSAGERLDRVQVLVSAQYGLAN